MFMKRLNRETKVYAEAAFVTVIGSLIGYIAVFIVLVTLL